MKNYIYTALLCLSFNSFAGIQIVSDLDDTIKVTNSDNIWDSIGYGAARRKVYLGVPELLAGARSYVDRVNLVTASPRILEKNVRRLLAKHDIQVENIILNGNIKRPGHIEFKTTAIRKIMAETNDQFIFMGDDVGDDPEIFDQLMKEFPDRVLASYIHVVKDREVPDSVSLHYTAYELAVKESLTGRLSKEAVTSVAQSLLNAKDLEAVFPEFSFCPKKRSYYSWLNDTEFADEAKEVVKHLTTYCSTQFEAED